MAMSKTKRDSIIAVVMVVACVAASFRTFKLSKHAAVPHASAPTSSNVEKQLLEDAQFINTVRGTQQNTDLQASRWEQEWERDPFRAEEAASGGGIENLVLQGIYWETDEPRAVINDKILRLGEAIDGYKVVEIRPASALLWTGEKNLELRVFKSPFLRAEGEEEEPAPKDPRKEENGEAAPAAEESAQPSSLMKINTNNPLEMISEVQRGLKNVEKFATDTSGVESMMKMMGSSDAEIKKALTVKQAKDGSAAS